MKRKATAVWEGSGKEGKGTMKAASGVLKDTPYSYKTRFENEPGTNPEELIAAAHAGCFSMKLSFVLGEAGFTPESIETTCEITLDSGSITTSELSVTAKVPGISEDKFKKAVEEAAKTCPVSKVLNAKIIHNEKLV